MKVRSLLSAFFVLIVVFSLFALSSCQLVTPADRISENRLLFRSLPAEQQLMVQQGRICEGMSPEVVYLAWGNPTQPAVKGQKNGRSYEKWVYSTMQPVMVDTPMWMGACRHGWYGGGGVDTVYVPREVAYVVFENGKVTEWESRGK